MRVLSVLLVLCLSVMSSASAYPVLFHPGTGVPNPGQGDSRAMWSEPPDLNGLIESSEQVLGWFETEIANDFVPSETTITHATWWGGYYNNNLPCQPGNFDPGFNLEFFADGANYLPGDLIAYLVINDFTEEYVGCEAGVYPLYKYGADVSVAVVPGTHTWFCPQMKDHAIPPDWGRLQSIQQSGWDCAFRSAYFGYPDWAVICSDIIVPCDFSQEFEGDHSEACCFADGHCELILTEDCEAGGGIAQGSGSVCDPNPCTATPARLASWGAVKALFR